MNIKISESLKHFNYLQSELDAVYHEASLKPVSYTHLDVYKRQVGVVILSTTTLWE